VLQLSLDTHAPGSRHVEIARALAPLRDHGVMIVGSGNIVHNLGAIRWQAGSPAYEWAEEFDSWVAQRLIDDDVAALADYETLGRIASLAAPTNDHYLPLLYAAALRRDGESLSFAYEGLEMGSLSMRSIVIGGAAPA
jgi:4,5-DOPA dioxygenase extradiol